MRRQFLIFSCLILLFFGTLAFLDILPYWLLILFGTIIFFGLYDMVQKKHALKRNFPLVGRGRYFLENLGPKMYQYFVESNIEGRPFHKNYRSIIYQRAKNVNDTHPFGTQFNVYEEGYEWIEHSCFPKDFEDLDHNPRIKIGGHNCKKPYMASILNISAMSLGSLSPNAIMALNGGAKKGNFAHNTGEGGISTYHLKYGGDIIWQIGTGYFGARTADGKFSEDLFTEKASLDVVKMIEIKLSQGAKPGHGGILPAAKNTPEIAKIRGLKPYTEVISPSYHTAFRNNYELLEFIQHLRNLSRGKPVGIKLCLGIKEEFIELCEAMHKTQILPDFITVDGGEGGTGAAPLEYSNSIGYPLREGLSFVIDMLIGFDLKQHIKIICSGKIVTGFHMARVIAMGADLCNGARSMMMALGCIQALQCNQNTCPVGVATQNKKFTKGLVVKDKIDRVANYHNLTVHSFLDLISSIGLMSPSELKRNHINIRTNIKTVQRYDEIYPPVSPGSFLKHKNIPSHYLHYFNNVFSAKSH